MEMKCEEHQHSKQINAGVYRLYSGPGIFYMYSPAGSCG